MRESVLDITSAMFRGLGVAVVFTCSFFTLGSIPAHASERLPNLENSFVRESSGICASRKNPGIFWTHNDSGSGPYIFAFNEQGRDRGTFKMQVGSEDIEDIAAATIGGVDYLLVANTGVDGHGAPSKLYLIKEPAVDNDDSMRMTLQDIPVSDVKILFFRWPGNIPRNCEAVGLSNKGEVFLATKTYPTSLYMIKLIWDADGGVTASPIRSIGGCQLHNLNGGQSPATGMDVSPDGRSIFFVHDPYHDGRGTEFTLDADANWDDPTVIEQVYSTKLNRMVSKPSNILNKCTRKEYGQLGFNTLQPEGVCYSVDGKSLYMTSEGGKNRTSKPWQVVLIQPGPDGSKIFPSNGPTQFWKFTRQLPETGFPTPDPS